MVSLYKVFPAWIITSNYWQCSGYFVKSTAFLFLVHSCVSDSLVTFIIWDVVKLWLNLGRLSRYQVPKSSIFQIPIWVDVVYALFTFHSSLMCQMEFTLIELGHLQAKAWCEHRGVSHYLPIYGQSTSSFSSVNANFLDIVLVSCGIYSKIFFVCANVGYFVRFHSLLVIFLSHSEIRWIVCLQYQKHRTFPRDSQLFVVFLITFVQINSGELDT